MQYALALRCSQVFFSSAPLSKVPLAASSLLLYPVNLWFGLLSSVSMELFFTLSLALFLSVLIAKLVSVALTGRYVSYLKSTSIVHHQNVLEELHGDRFSVRGFESQKKVERVETAVLKVHECVGVRAPSHDIIEVPLRRENEEETSQLYGNLEKSSSGEKFDCNVLAREVSDYDSLDDSNKSDGYNLKQVKEINIDDSEIETTHNRFEEKNALQSTNNYAALSQTVKDIDLDIKGNGQKLVLDIEDYDDWEGIERSEIENIFAAASKFVGSRDIEDRLANLGRDLQMEFYGLHKVATEGPCHEPQPVPLKVSARAKWNAWQSLGNISPDEAMEQYISLLSNTFPGWMEATGQSLAEPLEAETPSAPVSTIRTSTTQRNSSNESKAELYLDDKRGAHVGDLKMMNSVEG